MGSLKVTQSYGNVVREKAIDLSSTDFVDTVPFFVRAEVAGNIKYIPACNEDDETITKTVEASVKFDDPVLCRKVFKTGTTATTLYAGYGVPI